jgi:hypothetical protein
MSDAADRLDSWKAIADYLNRDVRTLRRWEAQGLPVRRVPGGRGHSVFAFRSEIDAWLKAHVAATEAAVPVMPRPPVASSPAVAPLTAAPAPEPASRDLPAPHAAWPRAAWRYAGAVVVVAIAIFGWKALAPSAARQDLTVTLTRDAIVASDRAGVEAWRHDFGSDVVSLPEANPDALMLGGPEPAALIKAFMVRRPDDVPINGVLRWFSLEGRLQRSFSFTDQWTFAGRQYGEPWAITDVRANDAFGRRHIAVAGHHYTWWPSVVTVLDDRFQREGTFVNSGWVEIVRWVSPDHLAIAGFNQEWDGGMFAVLDTHDLDGASPERPGSPYVCDNCRGSRPVFYAVFPRSELNRVMGAPFNRAGVEVQRDGFAVHTQELAPEVSIGQAEAVYEFSRNFDVVTATYGSRYWDQHRALELAGKITHTREECPERNGPPFIMTWTREAGWTKVIPKR